MERRLSTLALLRRAEEIRLRGEAVEARRGLEAAARREAVASACVDTARQRLRTASAQCMTTSSPAGRGALAASLLEGLRLELARAEADLELAAETHRAADRRAEEARARFEQAVRDRSAAEGEGQRLAMLRLRGRARREQEAADEFGQRRRD